MSRSASAGFFVLLAIFAISTRKLYPFQTLSLGCILKIFLKFRKFRPRYSYKIYSYKEKECKLELKQVNNLVVILVPHYLTKPQYTMLPAKVKETS